MSPISRMRAADCLEEAWDLPDKETGTKRKGTGEVRFTVEEDVEVGGTVS